MKSLGTRIRVFTIALALGSGVAHAAQWAKTYGNDSSQTGGVFARTGGGFWLYGTVATPTKGQDSQFGRVGANGNIVWAKQFGGTKNDALGVEPLSDGYLVTGTTRSFPAPGYARNNLLWAKYDLAWNPVFVKVFGDNAKDESGGFKRTADGGLLFTGTRTTYVTSEDYDSDILLIRTRPDGTIRWKKILDFGVEDSVYQAFELGDGFVVAGTQQDPTTDAWGILVMKLNKTTGAILWKKRYTFDGTGTTTALGGGGILSRLSDGSFLIMGSLVQTNPLLGGSRLVLAKIDGTGAILWSKSYGSSTASVSAFSASQNPADQSVLLSGSLTVTDFMSPNFGNSSILALVVNPSTGAVVVQKRLGALSEFNTGSIVRSGTLLYVSGSHGMNLQDFAQHPKILYARLNATTFAATWAKAFGGAYKEFGSAMKTGGTWALGGTTYSFGNSTSTKGDLFAMTLDATGNYPNCFIETITLPVAAAGVTAQALTLDTASPTLTVVSAGNPITTPVLPVTNAALPSTDICSPIASAQE